MSQRRRRPLYLEQGEALGVRGHVRLHGAERGGQALAPRRLLLHEGREVGQVRAGRGAGVRGVVYTDRTVVRKKKECEGGGV
jgi:hypothetical protein